MAKSFEYQKKLKEQMKKEEEKMEQEFKQKMLEKFKEDERVEQMNAQKRRMKELDFKKEVERLWTEKLNVYREQRAQELKEKEKKDEEERRKEEIVFQEKERLLREHAELLEKYFPKAAAVEKTKYAQSKSGTGAFMSKK